MTGKRAIFHIGMHKTGTTVLQSALQGYDDGLVRYADLGEQNHSVPFATMFWAAPEQHREHRDRRHSDRQVRRFRKHYLERLEREVEKTKDTLLFSGESLWYTNVEALSRLKAHFDRYFDRYKVVCYVRDPLSFANSSFSERLKGRRRDFLIRIPKYRDHLLRHSEVFGPEALSVFEYARERFEGGSVVNDFARKLGLDAPLNAATEKNASLSLEAMQILFALNNSRLADLPDDVQRYVSDRFRAALGGFGKGRFSFDPAQVAAATDAEQTQWLLDRFGIDFTRPGRTSTPACSEAEFRSIAPETIFALQSRLTEAGLVAGDESGLAQILDRATARLTSHFRAPRRRFRRWLRRRQAVLT